MELVLDCEWNSFGGELISIALVPRDVSKEPFYEVLPLPTEIDPWVANNVIPHLNKASISKGLFQSKLEEYLMRFAYVEIVADWHEDIQYFCTMLTSGPGLRISTPPLYFRVERIETTGDVPHNALSDATAIRDALFEELDQSTTFSWPNDGITCFHCGDHFNTPSRARLHFGGVPEQKPLCQVPRLLPGQASYTLRALQNWLAENDVTIPDDLNTPP